KFSMKQMHKLIVTSDTYKLASHGDPDLMTANRNIDPGNRFLWGFRLRRLEAEPIWDSILYAAGNLDLSLGGPSFDIEKPVKRPGGGDIPAAEEADTPMNRRGAYIIRGFSTSRDIVPNFL